MSKMIELLAAIKGQAAMLFGGAIALYVVAGWWFGHDALPFAMIVQMALLALICAAWQYICFARDTKHRFTARTTAFFLVMYLVLSAFAYIGKWFPFTVSAWLIFTSVFIVIGAIMFGIFGAYFRITGTRYNQMLSAYKNRHATQGR